MSFVTLLIAGAAAQLEQVLTARAAQQCPCARAYALSRAPNMHLPLSLGAAVSRPGRGSFAPPWAWSTLGAGVRRIGQPDNGTATAAQQCDLTYPA